MCTSYRDDRKLENTVKQSRFKHLGELHKEWTEAGVSASRVTMLRHLQEKGGAAVSAVTWVRSRELSEARTKRIHCTRQQSIKVIVSYLAAWWIGQASTGLVYLKMGCQLW